MSFSSEEIAKIHVEINSGDIPDFSEKMRDAAKSVSQLQEEIQLTQKDLGILAARGDQNTENFKIMQGHLSKLQTQLKNTNKEMKYYTESIDINLMSSNQLNARSKILANTLNALSKEAEPDRWNELNDELIKVRRRMDEVRVGSLGVSDSMDITGMSMQQLDVYSRQLKSRLAAVPRDAANSPEWNKLKKRLDEVKKEQEKVSSSMSSEFSGIFKKIGWGALFQGAFNTLKKIGQDIIANSNAIGDKWNRTMTGMKKGYEAFLTVLASGDWSNFFSNIERAYREGRELAEMQEALFEMQNATSLTETRNNIEISRQTAIMRDTTRSNEERIGASERILELEQEIMDVKKKTAERARDSALKEIAIKTKGELSEEDMTFLVDDYFQNEEMIDAAGEYLKLEDRLKELKTSRWESENWLLIPKINKAIDVVEQQMKDMLADTEGLDKVVDIQKKYDLLNDEQIQNYVKAQTDYLKAQADFEQATLRARTTLAKLREELKTEEYEKEAAKVEEWAAQERIAVKQRAADRQITEEEMNAELESIETERLRRVSEVNKKFGIDILESTEAVLDDMISSMDGFTQAAAEGSEEALDGALQKARDVNAEIEKMLDGSIEAASAAVQGDLEDRDSQLASDVELAGRVKTQFADKKSRLGLLAGQKEAEIAQMRSIYEEGLISEEEYQKARVDIIRRYGAQAREIQSESWEENLMMVSNVLSSMAATVQSIQEAQTASLEAQMQKDLAAAGSNADERAAIEERYEAKKLALQKKYADINMGIQIAQALASGALAMVQAWNAAAGNPVLAGIIMGLIAATTAAQVATIVAQRNAIMNSSAGSADSASVRVVTGGDSGSGGYSEGGFTGYGGRLEPAGIVHRGEYVVPVPEMRDPEAYSHVMAIERIRSRRSRHNPLPGFADGGYTGAPSSGTDSALGGVMSELRALRRNPIKAYVVLSELDAQKSLRDTHLKAGSRR